MKTVRVTFPNKVINLIMFMRIAFKAWYLCNMNHPPRWAVIDTLTTATGLRFGLNHDAINAERRKAQ